MARQLTITVDDDVAARVEETRRTGAPVDAALNAAARAVLERFEPRPARRFVVRPFNLGKPRISLDCISAALEAEDAAQQK
jgi:hypothetical protein